jgi:uncharacterized protein YbaP (TraB family)
MDWQGEHMKFKQFFAGILCVFFLTGAVQAGSPVWKVSQKDHHFYLGGTIHILGESDYPLPRAFDAAYDKSDILVFETDIQKSRAPEFTEKFMAKMVYSDNRTLKKLLTPDTFRALTIFAADRDVPVDALNRFKPGLVLVSLTLLEVERLGVNGIGVDEFFFSKAVEDGKPRHHLESLEEQISFFENMGQGNEDALIAYIIRDLETLPKLLPVIKSTWKSGNVKGLDRAILAPLKNDFPQLYQSLFIDRNQKWMPRLQAMATTPEIEFILVGAAHLAGEKGLLALLKDRGFTITNQ